MSPRRVRPASVCATCASKRVAERVAVTVVDALQIVDVDHQEGGLGVVAPGPSELPFGRFEEPPAVERPRQIVGLGELREAGPGTRILEDERGGVRETGDEFQLVVRECTAVPMNVERTDHTTVGDERHSERLVARLTPLEDRCQLVFGLVPLEHDESRARHELFDRIGERAQQPVRRLLAGEPREDVGDPLVGAEFEAVLVPYSLCFIHVAAVARLLSLVKTAPRPPSRD